MSWFISVVWKKILVRFSDEWNRVLHHSTDKFVLQTNLSILAKQVHMELVCLTQLNVRSSV